jgi:hypothetical protein
MEFVQVESSMISGVFYDDFTSNLFIEFKNGPVYYYRDVPKFLYQEMMEAESKGKFFSSRIKKEYSFGKVTGES